MGRTKATGQLDVANGDLTVEEVARFKKVACSSVYRAVASGRLASERVFGRIVVRVTDVHHWQPVARGERPGSKGRGGRPKGTSVSEETRERISAAQTKRWARVRGERING